MGTRPTSVKAPSIFPVRLSISLFRISYSSTAVRPGTTIRTRVAFPQLAEVPGPRTRRDGDEGAVPADERISRDPAAPCRSKAAMAGEGLMDRKRSLIRPVRRACLRIKKFPRKRGFPAASVIVYPVESNREINRLNVFIPTFPGAMSRIGRGSVSEKDCARRPIGKTPMESRRPVAEGIPPVRGKIQPDSAGKFGRTRIAEGGAQDQSVLDGGRSNPPAAARRRTRVGKGRRGAAARNREVSRWVATMKNGKKKRNWNRWIEPDIFSFIRKRKSL
jgi:hypothetical protein